MIMPVEPYRIKVVEGIRRASQVRGLKIVFQSPQLLHFTARLEEV